MMTPRNSLEVNSTPQCIGTDGAFQRNEDAFRSRFVGVTWAFPRNGGEGRVYFQRIFGQNGCHNI